MGPGSRRGCGNSFWGEHPLQKIGGFNPQAADVVESGAVGLAIEFSEPSRSRSTPRKFRSRTAAARAAKGTITGTEFHFDRKGVPKGLREIQALHHVGRGTRSAERGQERKVTGVPAGSGACRF